MSLMAFKNLSNANQRLGVPRPSGENYRRHIYLLVTVNSVVTATRERFIIGMEHHFDNLY